MTFTCVSCFIRTIDRHHARAAGSDVWMLHWSQLHTCLIIDFTLTDIRTVKGVTLVIKPHQSILLLPYLVFLEVGTTLALVTLHFLSDVAATCCILIRNISIALGISIIQMTFTHAIVL